MQTIQVSRIKVKLWTVVLISLLETTWKRKYRSMDNTKNRKRKTKILPKNDLWTKGTHKHMEALMKSQMSFSIRRLYVSTVKTAPCESSEKVPPIPRTRHLWLWCSWSRGHCLWSSACPGYTGTTQNPSFSLQRKSDESTKHYLTQMLLAINWCYWQVGKNHACI